MIPDPLQPTSQESDLLNPFARLQSRPYLTFALLGAIGLAFLGLEIAGGSTNSRVLVTYGAIFGPAILDGETWRLFTHMFLHIGTTHLFFNAIAMVMFGFEMERIYGSLRYGVIYFLSGLFGGIASFGFRGAEVLSAGASGAIFGIIGMNLAFFLYYRQRLGEFGRQRVQSTLTLIGINLFIGFVIISVDNLAHIGGLLAGFALGYLLVPRYVVSYAQSPRQVIDKGGLQRRWWVITGAVLVWLGAVWFAINYWTNLLNL
ncbi:MAG: rhomboid family intramembrane serine protease [Chloroflexota bacterium]